MAARCGACPCSLRVLVGMRRTSLACAAGVCVRGRDRMHACMQVRHLPCLARARPHACAQRLMLHEPARAHAQPGSHARTSTHACARARRSAHACFWCPARQPPTPQCPTRATALSLLPPSPFSPPRMHLSRLPPPSTHCPRLHACMNACMHAPSSSSNTRVAMPVCMRACAPARAHKTPPPPRARAGWRRMRTRACTSRPARA